MPKFTITKFYWLLPFFLFFLQALYTIHSNTQIRWEEMELLRDNYWFAHHLVWLRGYDNFGGYATADFMNTVFGFHIFNFKHFRLFLALPSLYCAAFLLERFLGKKAAIMPLLTFGLSPTLLFFNTLQSVYGLDLQYFPILLYLAVTTCKNSFLELFKVAMLWLLAMFGWLSYPAMAFYVPVIAILFLKRLGNLRHLRNLGYLCCGFIAFVTPLVLSIAWITNKDMLFGGQNQHGGLLLSGGHPMLGVGVDNTVFQALSALLTNLFFRATAYHYEVNQVEFSGIIPIFSLLFLFWLALKGMKNIWEARLPTLLCFGLIFLNVALASISVWSNIGFRRYTPVLMGIYALLAIDFYVIYVKDLKLSIAKKLAGFVLSVFLIHHILVYPINLMHLSDPSPFKVTDEKSIMQTTNSLVKGDVHLQEENVDLYAAVMSSCFWNTLPCHQMYGYSETEQREVKFSIERFSRLARQAEKDANEE